MRSWYEPLRQIQSKGATAERPGSLAGLHAARAVHEGQFFTSDALAAWVWKLVEQVVERALGNCVRLNREAAARVAIYDNSIGSGRLIQYADPLKYEIYGCDVDTDAVQALSAALKAADFVFDLANASMTQVRAEYMTVAVINPPFSLTFSEPAMELFASSAFGRYGPYTSALSHQYAVEQALSASEVVFAVVPATYAAEYAASADRSPRLRVLYELPAGLFRSEGTDVRVSLLGFTNVQDYKKQPLAVVKIESLDDLIGEVPVSVSIFASRPRIRQLGVDASKPSITLPVTGENLVRVVHDGRRIKLKFTCGLVQAKVLNAVYKGVAEESKPEGRRLPKGVEFDGQGLLDVEQHLAQPDPLLSFNQLIRTIQTAGATPEVDAGVFGYIKRRAKEVEREREPLRHVVRGTNPNKVTYATGMAKQNHMLDKSSWTSPVIKRGDTFVFTPDADGAFTYMVAEQPQTLTRDELISRFDVTWPSVNGDDSGWYVGHEGRAAKFPEVAEFWRQRATQLGIDKWLTWDFQFEDLIELMVSPCGAVVAWEQACGKARLSIALCLLSSDGPGLVAMPAHLTLETAKEIANKLPILTDDWQIIDSAEKLKSLKRINLISLSRLRLPIDQKRPRATYAKLLRRRIKVMVGDEGEMVANTDSSQTRAIEQVSAKRLFLLTGTPLANYPRNILPLIQSSGGDGTAAQRYGRFNGFIDPNLIRNQAYAQRGVDVFRESFVTTVWSTNEFNEDLKSGAKREIPKIANLSKYREAISPFVLRRLVAEPEVAKFVNIPVPTSVVTEVEWDSKHLGFYLKTAHEFASWYRHTRAAEGNKLNLIALLARIGAVVMAGNNPMRGNAFGGVHRLTSKQRAVLARLEEWTGQGRKSIMFAHNPDVIDLMHRELKNVGINSVPIHGGVTIKQRSKQLDEEFRYGDTPVLLASYGVAQAGYNLPQASRVAMYSRDWRHKVEDQAIKRVLRHDQKLDVLVEYFHLRGGIDEYQAQMVAFKSDAAAAGLDWATPQNDDVEFLHIDTLLGRFVEDLIPHGLDHKSFYEALLARGENVDDVVKVAHA